MHGIRCILDIWEYEDKSPPSLQQISPLRICGRRIFIQTKVSIGIGVDIPLQLKVREQVTSEIDHSMSTNQYWTCM